MLSVRVSFSLSVTREKENTGNHTVFYKKVQQNYPKDKIFKLTARWCSVKTEDLFGKIYLLIFFR